MSFSVPNSEPGNFALTSPLTFGVEIEMIIEREYTPAEWPAPDLERMQAFMVRMEVYIWIRGILRAAGLQVNDMHTANDADHLSRHSRWTLEWDGSIEATQKLKPPTQRFSLELISPKLTWEPQNLLQIETALKALKQNMRLYTSASCGVHVHVGQADDGVFPLDLAKRLACVIVAHESLMERFYNRQSSEVPEGLKEIDDLEACNEQLEDYCKWNTEANPGFAGLTAIQCAQKIQDQVHGHQDLVMLMNPQIAGRTTFPERHYRAYNFIGLD